jgi:PAS domain S-box-containing protein
MTNTPVSVSSLAPKFPLSLLLVENNAPDAQLYVEALSSAQFDLTAEVARTPEEFVEKLQLSNYDIILASYHLGATWTGMDALDLLLEQGRDIPFILLTDPLGDQLAVDYMKSGIADYILKDRLDRLPVAIYRALEQRATRQERLSAERALEHAENKFHALAEFMPAAVFLQQGTQCTYVNRAAEAVTGFRRGQLMQMSFWQMITKAARPTTYEQIHRTQSADRPVRCHTQITTKWGTERWLECRVKVLQMDGGIAALITAIPISGPPDRTFTSEETIGWEQGSRSGPAGTTDVPSPLANNASWPRRGPVQFRIRKQAFQAADASSATESHHQGERDAEDLAADQRASDELDAILHVSASPVDDHSKVRAPKPSYLQ